MSKRQPPDERDILSAIFPSMKTLLTLRRLVAGERQLTEDNITPKQREESAGLVFDSVLSPEIAAWSNLFDRVPPKLIRQRIAAEDRAARHAITQLQQQTAPPGVMNVPSNATSAPAAPSAAISEGSKSTRSSAKAKRANHTSEPTT